MAKPLTTTWQEALSLAGECRIVGTPKLIDPGTLIIQLEVPALAKRMFLKISAGFSGSISPSSVQLTPNFTIVALEPEVGEIIS